jgi:hypothetical protein
VAEVNKTATSAEAWANKKADQANAWINDHQDEITAGVMATVADVAVTTLCEAATAGVGSLGCLAAGGLAGGAMSGAMLCPAGPDQMACIAQSAGEGALTSLAFGAGGRLLGKAASGAKSALTAANDAHRAGNILDDIADAKPREVPESPTPKAEPTTTPKDLGSADQVGTQSEPPVLFGQARIGENFSRGPKVPSNLSGRPLADVSADLRALRMSPDEIPIQAFEHDGQLVTVNNRGLAALSDAGFRPTNLSIVDRSTLPDSVLERLLEIPTALGGGLPSPSIAVTKSMVDWKVIRTITIAEASS